MNMFISSTARARACAAVATGLLVACGGGGSDEGTQAPIAVTYTPAAVTQSYTQHFDRTYYDAQSPDFVKVTATFASPPPSDVVVVRLLMNEAVFGRDPINFSPVGNSTTRFEATVLPDQMLGPGLHEGDVTLRLCRDTACTRIVPTTGSLHYRLDVRAGLRARLTVNGVEFTNPGGAVAGTSGTVMFPDIPAGARADFSSNIPVTWTVGGRGWGSTPCDLFDQADITRTNESPTTLSVTVDNHGPYACQLQVNATPLDTQLREAGYSLNVAPR